MQVLIFAGNVTQAVEIRDAIIEVNEEGKIGLCYDSRLDTYVAPTKTGSQAEKLVCLMPHLGGENETEQLEALRKALVKKLSLDDSQVACPVRFPATF